MKRIIFAVAIVAVACVLSASSAAITASKFLKFIREQGQFPFQSITFLPRV
jgi:hypothetical protein